MPPHSKESHQMLQKTPQKLLKAGRTSLIPTTASASKRVATGGKSLAVQVAAKRKQAVFSARERVLPPTPLSPPFPLCQKQIICFGMTRRIKEISRRIKHNRRSLQGKDAGLSSLCRGSAGAVDLHFHSLYLL